MDRWLVATYTHKICRSNNKDKAEFGCTGGVYYDFMGVKVTPGHNKEQ